MSRLPNVRVRKNSAGSVFERAKINLIEGTGITITIADDSVDQEVDITVTSTGGASFATPAILLSTAAAAGVAATVIRSDATIAAFDATAPVTQAFGDAAATGSINFAARRDHKHGMPSFATNAIVLGSAAAAGVATTPFRSDDTIKAFDTTAPTTSAVGDAAAVGSIAFAARRDHVHGREAFGGVTVVAEGDASANGSGTTPAHSDHNHGWPWQYSRLKKPVRVCADAFLPAFTYSGGVITASANGALGAIDGITLVLNDRLLVNLQVPTSPAQDPKFNGVYKVTQVGDATHPFTLTREPDYDATAEVDGGTLVYVQEGDTKAGQIYEQQVAAPTLDTDALVFAIAGTNPWVEVICATTAALPANTYNSGAKTLTATLAGTLTVDGHTVVVDDLILVKDEATGSHNGIYRCTTAGSVSVAYVLTRWSGYDTTKEVRIPWEIRPSTGTANVGFFFMQTTVHPTIDTDALVYAKAHYDFVATSETTTSLNTYVDLTTVGPQVSVNVPLGAKAIVCIFSASMNSNTANTRCQVTPVLSGANTVAASDANALVSTQYATASAGAEQVSREYTLLRPAAGWTTVKLQYAQGGAASTGTYLRRKLTVLVVM